MIPYIVVDSSFFDVLSNAFFWLFVLYMNLIVYLLSTDLATGIKAFILYLHLRLMSYNRYASRTSTKLRSVQRNSEQWDTEYLLGIIRTEVKTSGTRRAKDAYMYLIRFCQLSIYNCVYTVKDKCKCTILYRY